MRSFRKILLATDMFDPVGDLLRAAARLSEVFEARIHLLHVVKRQPDLHLADFPISQLATDQLLQVKNQLIGMRADTVVLPVQFGDPAETIRSHAESIDADLIVIGTGRGRADGSPIVGPVAEAVIQRARQPVLAVYPGTSQTLFNKILCPVDHSSTSRRGLKNAIRLASLLESELIVVSVVPDVSRLSAVLETGDFRHAAEEHERHWRADFDRFIQTIDFGDVKWRREIRAGEAGDQIDLLAREENVGLIVMGATGRTGLIRVLVGSVTRSVLRRLPCSILTVKDENLIDELKEEDVATVELLHAEGEALMEANSFDAAVAKFDQVLAHHPFHVDALFRRAEALERLGDSERAARSIQRAAALTKRFRHGTAIQKGS